VSGNAWVMASRSDGYIFMLCQQRKRGTPAVIIAGCRYFTMAAARKHWAKTRGGTKLGDETMAILDYFEVRAKIEGWKLS